MTVEKAAEQEWLRLCDQLGAEITATRIVALAMFAAGASWAVEQLESRDVSRDVDAGKTIDAWLP